MPAIEQQSGSGAVGADESSTSPSATESETCRPGCNRVACDKLAAGLLVFSPFPIANRSGSA